MACVLLCFNSGYEAAEHITGLVEQRRLLLGSLQVRCARDPPRAFLCYKDYCDHGSASSSDVSKVLNGFSAYSPAHVTGRWLTV